MDDIDIMKLKQVHREMCNDCLYKKEYNNSSLNNWIGTIFAVGALVMSLISLFK